MALSGTLDSFPLPEVLRLLGRSGQTGMLVVRADDQEMRGYLQGGQLLFAASGDERDVKSRLVGSGLLEKEGWDQVAAGEASADEVLSEDVSPLDYDRAVRSLTVDAFVEVMRRRQGSFEFEEGVTTSIRLGTELSIDDTLDEVDERLRAWNTIREVVPSMKARVQLEENLPDGLDTIDLSGPEWQLVAQVGSGSTVARLAKGTGDSEFEVASKIASLVNRGLVRVGESGKSHPGALERYPGVETSEDPLGGEGPTGWINELDSIAATADPDPEPEPPLLDSEEIFPQADDADVDDPGGVDFGLKGFAPKPGISGTDLAQKAMEPGDDSAENDFAVEVGEVDQTEEEEPVADLPETEEADIAEGDALEILGETEALADLEAALDAEEQAEAGLVDEVDTVADAESDEEAHASDEPSEDEEEIAEEPEDKSGPLPNLLRRRNKGLLAKELSSLTD